MKVHNFSSTQGYMNEDNDRTIVTLLGSYIPGYKAGGPTRSIANLVANIGEEFKFKIITLDRDHGDVSPYPEIARNRWVRVGNADVMYLSPKFGGLLRLTVLLASLDKRSVLYLNSFFSRRFSILAIILRWLGLSRVRSVVLAPRGEFSKGALKLKHGRKAFYIKVSAWLGLYRGVIWHASTHLEEADIRHSVPNLSFVHIANILAGAQGIAADSKIGIVATAKDMHLVSEDYELPRTKKQKGQLRCLFLSRISPKKNLLAALEILSGITGEVNFEIYGPIEDAQYWKICEKMIGTMPPNIHVKYLGVVEHDRVREIFAGHDLLFLPTFGENYGHVICEALSMGCPVLISDQTPWRNLQGKNAGWDIPLRETEQFRNALQKCVDADEEWYSELVTGATAFGRAAAADPTIINENRNMFSYAGSLSLHN